MASTPRRIRPGDLKLLEPTRITTKRVHEPRDERPRIPKPAQRTRPSTISVSPSKPCPEADSRTAERTSIDIVKSPHDPEIVDFAGSNTWPRRIPSSRRVSAKRPAPSVASELSFGILDYYLTASSPTPSPSFQKDAPRIETPLLDPAMDKFNFDLTPSKSSGVRSSTIETSVKPQVQPDAEAGARRASESLLDSSPLHPAARPSCDRKYSLFPNIDVTTPTRKSAFDMVELQPLPSTTPTTKMTVTSPYQQPSTIHRPRKESISSSVQSRKDSFTSFSGTRRIPMRILSSGTPKTIPTASNSTSTASPPSQQSRWSDDTVTSPRVATTLGPRTSFGSLLGGDVGSPHYPLCFFEADDDDDYGEAAPLRRKFRWHRKSGSLVKEISMKKKGGRFDERRSWGGRLTRLMLCGCFSS